MTGILIKSVIIGIILGAVLSITFSLLTASSSGRNAITGEPMELRGFNAVYFQLAEYGLARYLGSLIPSFLVLSVLAAVAIAVLLVWSGRAG